MSCAISGVLPEEPVVSIKTGHVFEKRLILKALKDSGDVCPVTKQDLHPEDLIPLQTNPISKPRPPDAVSIPGMINMFQTEWDALMLETYTLKAHLHTVRKELAHALYQHDAACRVIARLVKERDLARAALEQTKANVASGVKEAEVMEVEDGTGITPEIVKSIKTMGMKLSKVRRKRVKELVAETVKPDAIKAFKEVSSHPLHSASKAGITCLDVHATEQALVLTGGMDCNTILFNRKNGKIVDTLKAHKKPITSAKFHPTEQLIFTTSADNTAIIWGASGQGTFQAQHTLSNHTNEVTDCTLHPSGSYLVTSSMDKTWAFYDVATGACRKRVEDSKIQGGFTKLCFHPDGLLLGVGTDDSLVRIFNVHEQKNLANFRGHAGKVTGVSFSENGIHLASADNKGTVKLWDLRKLDNFKTFAASDVGAISSIIFDPSGSYLGVAGANIQVYNTKTWDVVKTFDSHKKEVTAVVFGQKASFVASTSLDRNLKFYS